ncbi:MAG TPA: ABC transporter permease [Xanthobacteraceae bacterium]|nr:ABC transporter permease [Xanthobacteraceae bacterium]
MSPHDFSLHRGATSLKAARWPWFALFLGKRLLRLALVLLGVAVVAFALAKASPIDPVDAYLGPNIMRVSPEQRELIAERWGFREPAATQLAKWLTNLLHGDLGTSFIFNQPVTEVLYERVNASLALTGTAWLLSGLLGFALGALAGTYEGSLADRCIRAYAYVLASTPTFWVAIVLLIVFSVWLSWAPFCCAGPPGRLPQDIGLLDRLQHLALPLAALSLFGISQITLHTRAKMIEIMRSDYVMYAFAQGATRSDAALRHGIRNAALPAITIQFASLGELFGGSALAEQVFSYPGLGKATVDAGIRGDVPLLLAITLFTALLVSVGNTIADLLYHLVDPRMHPSGARP